jgi:hypothetical protein
MPSGFVSIFVLITAMPRAVVRLSHDCNAVDDRYTLRLRYKQHLIFVKPAMYIMMKDLNQGGQTPRRGHRDLDTPSMLHRA